MNLTRKNIFKNSIAALGLKGVRVLEQLFLIPFFIKHWGAAYYGEWLTLTIIPSILGFADMGLGSSAANAFVLAYAGEQKQEAFDTLKTGFRIITEVIISALILGIVGGLIATHFSMFKHSLISAHDASLALVFMMSARFLSFYMQLYEANYRAAHKAALGMHLQTLSGCTNVGVGLIMLFSGYGVVGYAIGQFCIALFDNLCYGRIGLSLLKDRKNIKSKYQKSIANSIWKKGIGYLMNPVWQAILFQGTTFVVRVVLGPVAVTIFNTIRTLSRSINQMYSVINASIYPEIQILLGKGDFNKALSIFRRTIRVTSILAILGFVFMSIWGLDIYNLWTKHELNPPYSLWICMILSTAINAIWWPSEAIFKALNKPYKLSITGVWASCCALIISFFLVKNIGLFGIGLGCILFEIIMSVIVMPEAFKLLNVKS